VTNVHQIVHSVVHQTMTIVHQVVHCAVTIVHQVLHLIVHQTVTVVHQVIKIESADFEKAFGPGPGEASLLMPVGEAIGI
jgi:hypothetical protein